VRQLKREPHDHRAAGLAEGVGFVPKFTIFWVKLTQFSTLFKRSPSVFLKSFPLKFTDSFADIGCSECPSYSPIGRALPLILMAFEAAVTLVLQI
jgi:hypothetical protein